MADSNTLFEAPLAVAAVWIGRRFLDTPARLPAWDKRLAQFWKPAAALFVLALFIESEQIADLLDDAFLLSVLGLGLAVCWQLRTYRPAWLMGLGMAPYALLLGTQLLLTLLAPGLLKAAHEWFDLASLLAFGWLGALWLLARGQKKAEVAAQELRLAAEQQRRVENQNHDLAYLVHQRTAALASQTDELRATLSELQTTQVQLIQREKMASLGQLTAGIAHEIQNPLNFVNNFAEVSTELVAELEEARARPTRDRRLEAELLADLRQNLERIGQHGGRAAGIVRGMLEHARASGGARQPTDLNALCDEYLRLAYHGLRAKDKAFNATLQPALAAGLPPVEAVPGELGRVLLNLFTNAFYAVQKRQQTGEPGYVPTVGVRTELVGEALQITVHDNGTGMPAAVQQKIFQPFFTTKPSGEGTGLGLSLAHDIVVQGHGGTLRVDSQEGVGTKFIILLPQRGA